MGNTYTIVINQYTNSATGHVDVSFDVNGVAQYTYGENLASNEGISNAPFLAGGVYDESSRLNSNPGTSVIPVTDAQWNNGLGYAQNLANQTDNGAGPGYNIVTFNCVSFAQGVLNSAGVTGSQGSIVNDLGALAPVDIYAGVLDALMAVGIVQPSALNVSPGSNGAANLTPVGSTSPSGTITATPGSGGAETYSVQLAASSGQGAESGVYSTASNEFTSGNLNIATRGLSDSIAAAGTTLTLAANSSLNVTGTDTINMAAGDVATLYGTGSNSDGVNANYATVDMGANTRANVSGTGNVDILSTGDAIGVYGASQTVDTSSKDSVFLSGTGSNSDSVNATNLSGGDAADGQPTGIGFAADARANVNGNGNQIDLAAADAVGAYGGGDNFSTATDDSIYIGSTGTDSDTITATGLRGGYAADGQPTGIAFATNSDAKIDGNSDGITVVGGDNIDAVGAYDSFGISGIGAITTAGNDTFYGSDDSKFTTNGSGNTFDLGADNQDTLTLGAKDTDYIYGSDETVVGGAGDYVIIYGNNDTVDASGSTIIDKGDDDFTDGNSDDIARDGSDDGSSGSGDVYGGTGTDGGATGSGSSGVAAGIKRKTNVVSNYDLAHGYTKAASAADASWNRTSQAIATAAAPLTNIAPSSLVGAQWSSDVVTWSFATSPAPGASPFSSYIQSQYKAAIIQAFQTWAQAAGITLKQVADSSATDIRVGWGDFDTTDSGVLGYTSYQITDDVLQPGVTVRLEDPTEDALTAGPNGSFTYAGTTTTLEQIALHEVGHALGLAESSDPDSIMYPVLGPSNTTLNASDYQDIGILYQSAAKSGQGTLALMTQAMAAFGASTASAITSTSPTASSTSTQSLLATHAHA